MEVWHDIPTLLQHWQTNELPYDNIVFAKQLALARAKYLKPQRWRFSESDFLKIVTRSPKDAFIFVTPDNGSSDSANITYAIIRAQRILFLYITEIGLPDPFSWRADFSNVSPGMRPTVALLEGETDVPLDDSFYHPREAVKTIAADVLLHHRVDNPFLAALLS